MLRDIADSLSRWEVWLRLGLSDTVLKYKRSILGPLWVTLGMAITIVGLGSFWALIWRVELESFFPYLTAGIIIWNVIVSSLIEGANCFTQQAALIRTTPLPLFIHPLRLSVKIAITLAHNLIVFVAVALFFRVQFGPTLLLAIPGLLLLFAYVLAVVLLLGMVGARFRDIPPIIEAVVPLLFFLTPVLWFRSALGSREFFADFNPFTHFIEVVRAPLLGNVPSMISYIVVVAVIAVVWIFALAVFARRRTRLTLWI